MRLAESVRFASFDALARQPTFGQLEQNDGLWFVDLQKHCCMHVDGDKHDAGIVRGTVTWIAFLPEPYLPVGLVQFLDFRAVSREASQT
jgi:hypothetical protein